MAEPKTKPTRKSVTAFINEIEHPKRQEDAKLLLKLFKRVSGEKAVMWGDSIVGFGRYSYTQKNGQKATWMLTGFSPRKSSLSIYIMPGFDDFAPLLKKLGKHKTARSCLYVNKIEDIDEEVLGQLISDSIGVMKKRYG